MDKTVTGKVSIVAAGPGDPDLITVKAVKAIKQADVIMVDRLVSETILNSYAENCTEIVRVGKQCDKLGSVSQAEINALMVSYCLNGKHVVRLKGGDVTVFANVLDELQVLTKHSISYEIIPGITAGIGAAAYAGIPLTARGYATAVRFLTCYNPASMPDSYWQDLATTKDTLVFYMSVKNIEVIIKNLNKFPVGTDKHIAVIEQATTIFQRIKTTPLAKAALAFKAKQFLSPSIAIIGQVVALHEQFKWMTNNTSNQLYFTPVDSQVSNQLPIKQAGYVI